MKWLFSEAKNHLGEVVQMALSGQLQRISRRDETVILR